MRWKKVRTSLKYPGCFHLVELIRILQGRDDMVDCRQCFFRRKRKTGGTQVVQHIGIILAAGDVVGDLVDQIQSRVFAGAGPEINEVVLLFFGSETSEKIGGRGSGGNCAHTGDGKHDGIVLGKICVVGTGCVVLPQRKCRDQRFGFGREGAENKEHEYFSFRFGFDLMKFIVPQVILK